MKRFQLTLTENFLLLALDSKKILTDISYIE